MFLISPVRFVAANPISISVPTLIVEVVIFLAMVWLMERLVFTPIRTAWQERNEAIQAGIEASTATRDEAEEARLEVRRILNEARRQAQQVLDEVRAEGDRLRALSVEEATQEFQRLVAQARIEIQVEQAQASAQLLDLVVDLALEAASKVAGKSVLTPDARSLAAKVVSQTGLA